MDTPSLLGVLNPSPDPVSYLTSVLTLHELIAAEDNDTGNDDTGKVDLRVVRDCDCVRGRGRPGNMRHKQGGVSE